MPSPVDYYSTTYRQHATDAMTQVRRETYDEDIGQNSWLTAAELRGFLETLKIGPSHHVLEVACGSGGPGCYVVQRTGCRLTGIDNNAAGVTNARTLAQQTGIGDRTCWLEVDANARLPFTDAEFDVVLCVDALNHLRDRRAVLAEWARVLRKGGAVLFTDPVVVTGAVSDEELAIRSSIGTFLFVPPGYNERALDVAGFRVVAVVDATENAAAISERRRAARDRVRDELIRAEGESTFDGVQTFLRVVHEVTATRRLSRFVYHAVKK